MEKEQIIKALSENLPIRLHEGVFKELSEEWEEGHCVNEFEIERVGRGFDYVDLFHIKTGEVFLEIESVDLIIL